MNRHEHAIADFSEAVRIDPRDYDAYAALCWSRIAMNASLDAAIADCNASLRIQGNTSALTARGVIHLKRADFRSAFADFDRVANADPESMRALYGRGLASLRLGQPRQGQADIEAASERSPSIAGEYEGYGLTP
jgi:tetratricopeptide (TPR) repeat protein